MIPSLHPYLAWMKTTIDHLIDYFSNQDDICYERVSTSEETLRNGQVCIAIIQ